MIKISLTKGYFALIDDNDFNLVNQFSWRLLRTQDNNLYAQSNQILMHRLIMKCMKSDGQYIDHIDNDGLNNQKNNLRFCTQSQNSANSRKRTKKSSQYKGVTWIQKLHKWQAQIKIKNQYKYLGTYPKEKDAARIYDKAALIAFRKFAKLNFPLETTTKC